MERPPSPFTSLDIHDAENFASLSPEEKAYVLSILNVMHQGDVVIAQGLGSPHGHAPPSQSPHHPLASCSQYLDHLHALLEGQVAARTLGAPAYPCPGPVDEPPHKKQKRH